MADDPIRTAAAAENGLLKDTLLEATIKRTIYVLDVGEAWGDLDQTVGEKRLAIVDAAVGYLYLYDSTDTTTADDGLTCRVTGTSERYHIEDAASISISSVLDQQNSPPGSPANYDAYIVGTSPTGAWAAQATNLAIYTRRGWVFAEPETGMTVLNEATGANLQFAGGLWGDFGSELPDDSVLPVQLAFPAGVSIEAQQNAPPSVPGDPGILYLVGTAGSGDWSGHNNAFAFSRDATTWEFIAAYEGATVWNKATDAALRYNDTAWVSTVSGIVDYQAFTTPGAATWNKLASLPANARVRVEQWGAGGGGGGCIDEATPGGGGGGGGGYNWGEWLASELASSVSLNIGAGGNGGTGNADGSAGGNTTFGALLTAYGGGGGGKANNANGAGGGGGGTFGAGGTAAGPTPGTGGADTTLGGFGGAAGGTSAGNRSIYGGGGGAGNASGPRLIGGGSKFGGAGGNSGGSSGSPAVATSEFGGSGGQGGTTNNNGSAGSARGGGGGGAGAGAGSQTGGAGGRGEIRVTVFA